MPIDSSLHKQLPHLVAERLRMAIFDGVFKAGEWLRQERLAQEFGVSQMPVREALKELAAEGLVEHVPYRGVRVMAYSADDVNDLYAMRAFLEGRAAGVAAERITAEELGKLRELSKRMATLLDPAEITAYREANREFHRIVYTASRRSYLIRTLNQMWAALPTMLLGSFAGTATEPLPARDDRDLAEHNAIIAALAARDALAAEAAMSAHIAEAGTELVALIRAQEGAQVTGDSR
jgi:DNA-binding GntR family transcriptional regulator